MKKFLFTLFTLLVLLTIGTSAVFAAPLKGNGYLILFEVRNDSGGGVIFLFEVVGEFTKKELRNGFVYEGDNKYTMHCNLDGDILACTTSRATAGDYVNIYLNGFSFYARVPETGPAESAVPTEYCYGVYDAFWDDGYAWEQFATHCQDAPANLGDDINVYNPEYQDSYDYFFMNGSPACFDPIFIQAYYPTCPT